MAAPITEDQAKQLIKTLYEEPGEEELTGDYFQREKDALNELLRYGSGAIDLMLDEVEQRHSNGMPAAEALGRASSFLMFQVVDPRHASRVAGILSWDGVLFDRDRGHMLALLHILANIGSKSEIPALEAFREKIKDFDYGEFRSSVEGVDPLTNSDINDQDRDAINMAIAICRERPEV